MQIRETAKLKGKAKDGAALLSTEAAVQALAELESGDISGNFAPALGLTSRRNMVARDQGARPDAARGRHGSAFSRAGAGTYSTHGMRLCLVDNAGSPSREAHPRR